MPDAGDLPKELGTVENPESGEMRVTYDGWPLYRYVGDTAPGQATGEGVGDVWFVIARRREERERRRRVTQVLILPPEDRRTSARAGYGRTYAVFTVVKNSTA